MVVLWYWYYGMVLLWYYGILVIWYYGILVYFGLVFWYVLIGIPQCLITFYSIRVVSFFYRSNSTVAVLDLHYRRFQPFSCCDLQTYSVAAYHLPFNSV